MATARNTNQLQFQAAPQAAVGEDATHVGFWTAAAGGTFLGGQDISTNPDALVLGERYTIAASAITWTVNMGADFTEAMALLAVRGMISGTIYLSVHDGDPGTTGANEITDLTRVAIAQGDWTVA